MDASLIKKLRFVAGSGTVIINAPTRFVSQFLQSSAISNIHEEVLPNMDWALVFVINKNDVDELTPPVLENANANAMVWIAYPKKSSKIKTDITRDAGWAAIHDAGWAGVSLISIDDTWSAFRVRPQKKSSTGPSSRTSDAAVKGGTGKTWPEWYEVLNRLSGKDKSHQEIAKILHEEYKLDGWWAQMVTNSYEQEIGRRKKHERALGYEASVSKTFPIPIGLAYQSFADDLRRVQWLEDPEIEISTARENKSLRALWSDKNTRISVEFYAKGEEKTQIVVQHLKIKTADACEEMKAYWKRNLANLASAI